MWAINRQISVTWIGRMSSSNEDLEAKYRGIREECPNGKHPDRGTEKKINRGSWGPGESVLFFLEGEALLTADTP